MSPLEKRMACHVLNIKKCGKHKMLHLIEEETNEGRGLSNNMLGGSCLISPWGGGKACRNMTEGQGECGSCRTGRREPKKKSDK